MDFRVEIGRKETSVLLAPADLGSAARPNEQHANEWVSISTGSLIPAPAIDCVASEPGSGQREFLPISRILLWTPKKSVMLYEARTLQKFG